jgi:arylsulfatase A-like enzyme
MRQPLDRPNFVLINCDDLGYGDVGCYGSSLNRTPALDGMAAEGLRFSDFYMGAPVCSPSRAALMTGCYPRRNGMASYDQNKLVLFPGDAVGLHPSEVTLAALLRRSGYATMLAGKWHLGDQPPFLPTRHGFEEYFGLPYSNDMGRMSEQWPWVPLPLMAGEEVVEEQPDQASLTARYVERAVRFLRAHRNEPFFLYFAHMYVHVPIFAPQIFLQASRNGAYGAAVECVDWSVAALLKELRALGLDSNTLVIFTSDNGSNCRDGGSNGPLRGRKGTTWEGGLRVPCVMRWPGVISPGRTCKAMSTAMDLFPTLAGLAGAAPPGDRRLDGRDLRPLLLNETGAGSPHETFCYYRGSELEAVRAGRWKLHLKGGGLYDLETDLGEQHDVSAEQAEVAGRLHKSADNCRRDLGDAAVGAAGEGCRPIGRVEKPQTLTHYDPSHPYMIAMYDLLEKPPRTKAT